jgi:hypothetical protein
MDRYDRLALIYDPGGAELARHADGLARGGLEVLLARAADELALRASQHADRVGAVVLPGALALDEVDALLAGVVPSLPGGLGSVLVVAPRRERAHLRGLRDRGVRWVVLEPYDDAELRFAVAATLASEDALDPRTGLRVPIRITTTVRDENGATREAVIRNLSLGGAYVALDPPPEKDARVALAFALGDRPLEVEARVAHRSARAAGGRAELEPGMGVAFAPLDDEERRALDGFLRERIDAFRL